MDCDQVGPVGPNEVERVRDANGSMQSLGGVEASRSLVLTPTPVVENLWARPKLIMDTNTGDGNHGF